MREKIVKRLSQSGCTDIISQTTIGIGIGIGSLLIVFKPSCYFLICNNNDEKSYTVLPPSHNNCLFSIFIFFQNNCHFRIPMHHLFFFIGIPLFIEFHST